MSFFKFKQFEIQQNNSAMKVNTDGVLLGAWVQAEYPEKILDIGTGTGVIAIMMAQKFTNAEILGIEIDKNTTIDAKYNAENCKWSNRINILNDDFINFSNNLDQKFDLIISNPPFFENQFKAEKKQRELARHTSALPFEKLTKNVSAILSEKGLFAVVLPFFISSKFEHFCNQENLFCKRKTIVFPKKNKQPNRVLLEFSKEILKTQEDKFFIRDENEYSKMYLDLTKDFYLFSR